MQQDKMPQFNIEPVTLEPYSTLCSKTSLQILEENPKPKKPTRRKVVKQRPKEPTPRVNKIKHHAKIKRREMRDLRRHQRAEKLEELKWKLGLD